MGWRDNPKTERGRQEKARVDRDERESRSRRGERTDMRHVDKDGRTIRWQH